MTRISSPHKRRLLSVRRLAAARERKRSGRFFAEGEDLIRAARSTVPTFPGSPTPCRYTHRGPTTSLQRCW